MGSSSTAATVAAEKTTEELKREIEELNHQQREISDRIRDPSGLRHGGLAAHNNGPPRNFGVNGGATAVRQRGFVSPADRYEDQPAPKRRLSSAVVKEDGELTEDVPDGVQDVKEKESTPKSDANGNDITVNNDRKPSYLPQHHQHHHHHQRGGFSRRDGGRRSNCFFGFIWKTFKKLTEEELENKLKLTLKTKNGGIA